MRLCAVDPRAPLRSPAPPPATLAQRRVAVGGTDAPAHVRTHAHPWPSSRHVAAGVLHRLRHELRPVLHRQRLRLHVLRMGRPKASDSALSGPPSNTQHTRTHTDCVQYPPPGPRLAAAANGTCRRRSSPIRTAVVHCDFRVPRAAAATATAKLAKKTIRRRRRRRRRLGSRPKVGLMRATILVRPRAQWGRRRSRTGTVLPLLARPRQPAGRTRDRTRCWRLGPNTWHLHNTRARAHPRLQETTTLTKPRPTQPARSASFKISGSGRPQADQIWQWGLLAQSQQFQFSIVPNSHSTDPEGREHTTLENPSCCQTATGAAADNLPPASLKKKKPLAVLPGTAHDMCKR